MIFDDEKKVHQLKELMRLKPTLDDCAAFFECSKRTVERFVQDTYGITYGEFRQQRMVHTRFNLVRKAIDKALKGDNTMLIFCLKNMCGWKNEPGENEDVEKVLVGESLRDPDSQAKLLQIAKGLKK